MTTHPIAPSVLLRVRPVRALFFITLALLANGPALFAAPPTAPTHLRVNDVTSAIGTGLAPYFGWYVNDPDANEIQTRYQLVVAPTEAALAAGSAVTWDSGQVTSRDQNHVVYAGPTLTTDTKYFWKVRTWDKDGAAGPFSAPASFVIGLPANPDWAGAAWIRRDTNVNDDYTYYRKTAALPAKTVAHATVYVTSVHKYALYVNGTLVGKGPAYEYPQYQLYNAYDITALVKAGTPNLFAVFNHWFGAGQGRAGSARGVLMKAVVHYTDGTSTVIGTDATWKQSPVTAWIGGQRGRGGEGIGFVERIDARNLIPNWNTAAFDDSAWAAATVIGNQPVAPWIGELRPDLSRIVEKEIIPVSVTDKGNGRYLVDLGKVYAAVPRIVFSGGTAGAVVNMQGGYALTAAGEINPRSNQSTTLTYFAVLNGERFTYEPVEYVGMRYFEVTGSPMPITKENFRFVQRHNSSDDARAAFTSPNATLNSVYALMRHSITVNAQEQYVDTPTREKGAFLGDAVIQSIAAMPVSYDRVLTRRMLGDFTNSMDQFWAGSGRMNAVYPNNDGGRDIPDYTQGYLVWLWEYFMQTGDRAFLNAHYDHFKLIAEYVHAALNPATGLITRLPGGGGAYNFGIVDWPQSMRYGYDMTTAARTVINGWAWADYDVMSRVADVLGKTADRDTYRARADALKTAINTHLLNASGVYVDGLSATNAPSAHVSQAANSFPIALGLVPPASRATVVAKLKELKMASGMITVGWLVRALGEAGEGAHLVELLTNAEWFGWARILAHGGTSTWETWTADTDGNSMSHGWGIAGLDAYTRYLLGVIPLRPQYEQVQIKPLDCGDQLATASGTVPTDRGDITVEWKRSPTRYELKLTIPVNVTPVVYIPQAGAATTVKVDGATVTGTAANGYLLVPGVGSGTHLIER